MPRKPKPKVAKVRAWKADYGAARVIDGSDSFIGDWPSGRWAWSNIPVAHVPDHCYDSYGFTELDEPEARRLWTQARKALGIGERK